MGNIYEMLYILVIFLILLIPVYASTCVNHHVLITYWVNGFV